MWKASWKSLLGHKGRWLMSAISVILGVAFVSGSLMFTDMLDRSFKSIVSGAVPDVQVSVAQPSDDSGATQAAPLLDQSVVDKIETVPGVVAATGIIQGQNVFTVGKDGKIVTMGPAIGLGFSFMTLNAMDDHPGIVVKDGHEPRADDEVMIDPLTFERSGYALGDQIKISTPDGTFPMTLVGTAKWGTGGTSGASYVFFTDSKARAVMQSGEPGYAYIWVQTDQQRAPQDVADDVSTVIPDGYEASTGASTAEEGVKAIEEGLAFVNVFLLVFAAIALVVAAFLIVNTFTIIVAQRGRELALLRALGASRGQVRRSVLFEALVIGLLGSAVGFGLGIGLAAGITAVMAAAGVDLGGGIPPITVKAVVASFAVGLAVTLLACLAPARKASEVPAIVAMNGEQQTGTQGLGRRTVIGVIFIALGVVGLATAPTGIDNVLWFVGIGAALTLFGVALISPVAGRPLIWLLGRMYRALFGEVGKLAELNSVRQPRRTASTASALMVGLALVSMIGVISASTTSSVEQTMRTDVRGDLIVRPPGQAEFSSRIAQQIDQVDGVDQAVPTRRRLVTFPEGSAPIAGMTSEEQRQPYPLTFESGSWPTKTNELAVAAEYSKAKQLAVGDRVSVTDPFSGKRVELTVSGRFTYPDGVSDAPYLTNLETLDAFASPTSPVRDSSLMVFATPGANVDDVKSQIASLIADEPLLQVMSQEEFVQAQIDRMSAVFNVLYALLALAVIIAVLGIVNTLALSILERTREIGLLRAVGLTRGQIRVMVTLESIAISLLGSVLGLSLGLVYGVAIQQVTKDDGLSVLTIPWGMVAIALGVSIVVGILAAVAPARRAARTDVLDAISTE